MRTWHDGLEPELARGWSLAGSGWLERKEVIACVVITRGGSPKGSRRVARPAAALVYSLTVRIDQVRGGFAIGPGRILCPQVRFDSICPEFVRFRELAPLDRFFTAGDYYGLYFDRGWWWSWAFTRFTTGRRAGDGVSI